MQAISPNVDLNSSSSLDRIPHGGPLLEKASRLKRMLAPPRGLQASPFPHHVVVLVEGAQTVGEEWFFLKRPPEVCRAAPFPHHVVVLVEGQPAGHGQADLEDDVQRGNAQPGGLSQSLNWISNTLELNRS